MPGIVAGVKAARFGINKLDEATVDKDDAEAMAAYQGRKNQKRGIAKLPAVLANIYKKLTGGGKKAAVAMQPSTSPTTQQPPAA
jgi:hypothetical protein